MFCCLMRTGARLSDSALEALYQAALRMARRGDENGRIVHDDVCGTLETDYEAVTLGTFSGYQFLAEVQTPKGKKAEVAFIVQSADLEDNGDHCWLRLNRPKKKKKKKHD